MRLFAYVVLAIPAIVCAQNRQDVDFAAMIRTPAGIQAALERCDGNPDFETSLANWLETARPRSAAERDAIRQTSLRLLEDTTDRQVALGLMNGLLRHALDDVKRDPAIVPKKLAYTLHGDIAKAAGRQKAKASAVLAYGLADSLNDARQAGFIREFLSLAEPRAPAALSTRIAPQSGQ